LLLDAARPRSLEALTRSIVETAQKDNEKLLDQQALSTSTKEAVAKDSAWVRNHEKVDLFPARNPEFRFLFTDS